MKKKLRRLQVLVIVTVVLASVVSAQYEDRWERGSRDRIPADAVSGGNEVDKTVTYVCRARSDGVRVAGRLVAGRCYFADGRRERSDDDFDVLTDRRSDFRWTRDGDRDYAVPAGEENFVCRVTDGNGVYPGSLRDDRCRYARAGEGLSSRNFEILEGKESSADVIRASESGSLDLLRAAIRAGQLIDKRNSIGRTALMIAAEKGHDALIEELINNRASLNASDDAGNTALILASKEGKDSAVRRLLRGGAEAGIANDEGETALTEAAANGHVKVLRELMRDEYFSGIDSDESRRAFSKSAENGREDALEVFVENGMDVNSADPLSRRTALMEASAGKHGDALRYLLENGANVVAIDTEGYSAFQLAVIADSDKTLKIFIEDTRKIRPSDVEAERGLRTAARFGKKDSLDYLIKQNVDVNSRGPFNGFTPLMWAAAEGRGDSTEMLIKAGADLNAQNAQGETALMLAAAHSKTNTLKELISAGAKLDLRDRQGRTALDLAIANGHDDTRKELEKAGAVR
ncbi:MAG TPA: DM9 repeat-containing protein [Aridibacter sp.]|nr:DM9 repeat-containing protein [Aridibacter sp.]